MKLSEQKIDIRHADFLTATEWNKPETREYILEKLKAGEIQVTVDYNRVPWDANCPECCFIYRVRRIPENMRREVQHREELMKSF